MCVFGVLPQCCTVFHAFILKPFAKHPRFGSSPKVSKVSNRSQLLIGLASLGSGEISNLRGALGWGGHHPNTPRMVSCSLFGMAGYIYR